eukprot:scaffold84213_cov40-Prasinocladus_malaysianus.AAC.1
MANAMIMVILHVHGMYCPIVGRNVLYLLLDSRGLIQSEPRLQSVLAEMNHCQKTFRHCFAVH